MPHEPVSSSVICVNPSLRTILNRADGLGDDAGKPDTGSASTPPGGGILARANLKLAVWRCALEQLWGANSFQKAAFAAGFVVPLSIGLLMLLFWQPGPPLVSNVPGPTLQQQANLERPMTFAVPALKTTAMIPDPAPGYRGVIAVPATIRVTIGRRTPIALLLDDAAQLPEQAVLRVANLPQYAALTAGYPLEPGTWIVEPSAAKTLNLTVYAMSDPIREIKFDIIDREGLILTSARSWMSLEPPAPLRDTPIQTEPAQARTAALPIVPPAQIKQSGGIELVGGAAKSTIPVSRVVAPPVRSAKSEGRPAKLAAQPKTPIAAKAAKEPLQKVVTRPSVAPDSALFAPLPNPAPPQPALAWQSALGWTNSSSKSMLGMALGGP